MFDEIQLRKLVNLAKPTGNPSVQRAAAPKDTTPIWVKMPSFSWIASAPPLSPYNTRQIYWNVNPLVKVRIVTFRLGNLKKMLLKKIVNHIAEFGPIHMQTMDSNTLCTTDVEQWKLVTIRVFWVVASSFILWTVRSEFLRIYKWKTHIARALAVRGSTTKCASDNDTAKDVGTLLVCDDCEVHPLKYLRKCVGSCEK